MTCGLVVSYGVLEMSNPIRNKKTKTKQNKIKSTNTLKQILLSATKEMVQTTKRQRRGAVYGPTPKTISKGRNRGTLGLSDKPSGATTRRTTMICEDEYIGEIAGSTAFATTAYACNPGQFSMFPWGNKISSLYEEYDFVSLEFYYKREVSEYATNGTTGKVMLSFDYDASDVAPTTKQQVEDTVPHVDGMPSDPVIRLKIDCSRIRKNSSKYVRPGAQPANTDVKTYDAGTLYVSTFGNQSTGNLGELRVKYCLKLSEPVLEPASVVGGVVHFSTINATTASNFNAMVQQSGATPSLAGITCASNVITFPAGIPGTYLITVAIMGATSITALAVSSYGAGSVFNILSQSATRDNTSNVYSLAGTTSSVASALVTMNVPAVGCSITFTAATITGTGTGDVFIVSLPSTILTVKNPEVVDLERRLAALEISSSRRVIFEEDSEDDYKESPLSRSTVDLIAELQRRKFDMTKLNTTL